MRVALTGATGLVGHAVARHLAERGLDVVTLGRRPSALGLPHVSWALGARPDVACDALVHCAFAHVAGRYRGGEGDDPARFLRLNRDGTLRLLDGVSGARIVFLSSRAVYGAYPPGTRLRERTAARPDTLYGEMKRAVEVEVAARGGVGLRATGVYGPPPPGRRHKWAELFADFAAGRAVPPRVATELHADDLAAAVALCLVRPTPPLLNVSDIVLDRRDLLRLHAALTGAAGRLPARAEAATVCAMECDQLRALGWTPRGRRGLREALREMTGASRGARRRGAAGV